jgi:predicted acetyltransferase
LESLSGVLAQAFLEEVPPEALEQERQVVEYDRTIAAFDGDEMVGSAGAYSFQLTVPGGSTPAAGISLVAVLPSHRRRGILTGLMNHLMSDAVGRAEPVAILFASESVIYGRFGFGLASMHLRLRINRGDGKLSVGSLAHGASAVRLCAVAPSAAKAALAQVFAALLPHQPGMIARDERWWTYLLGDAPALRPPGMSALRCLLAEDDAGPRGYALYRTQQSWDPDGIAAGTLAVRELVATDAAATAALWNDLLFRDLVAEVSARMRPMDDPVLEMLADRRRARPELTDGLWVRLVDLPAALCQRQYAAAADIVLDVTDRQLPANAGRWRLRTDGPTGSGKVTCERTDDAADLRLPVQALGAAYLGGGSFGQLARAGHIAELTPGALGALAAAMSWHCAPHSGMMF